MRALLHDMAEHMEMFLVIAADSCLTFSGSPSRVSADLPGRERAVWREK